MAETEGSRLGYVICYVKDVHASVQFYSSVFGFSVRTESAARRWAELDTGSTTLAFTTEEQKETDLRGGVETSSNPNKIDIEIDVDDVDATFKRATSLGAIPVASPEPRPWGQKVGYLRDFDGLVIRLGSHIKNT